MKFKILLMVALVCGTGNLVSAETSTWIPVNDDAELKAFMSGVTLSREEGGDQILGTYAADGSGVLYAWGAEFSRSWSVVGHAIQVVSDKSTASFTLEKSTSNTNLFRAVDTATGAAYEIRKG